MHQLARTLSNFERIPYKHDANYYYQLGSEMSKTDFETFDVSNLSHENLLGLVQGYFRGDVTKTKGPTNLNNWDVSKFTSLAYLFSSVTCESLDVSHWNVGNCRDFSFMFDHMHTKTGVLDLINWDVSNGVNFEFMFAHSTVSGLVNYWNVCNGVNFTSMFADSWFLGKDVLHGWKLSADANISAAVLFNDQSESYSEAYQEIDNRIASLERVRKPIIQSNAVGIKTTSVRLDHSKPQSSRGIVAAKDDNRLTKVIQFQSPATRTNADQELITKLKKENSSLRSTNTALQAENDKLKNKIAEYEKIFQELVMSENVMFK